MDMKIFNQGLSVEATSAYIIIDALQNEGMEPRLSRVLTRWNISESALTRALADLLAHRVIALTTSSDETDPVYQTTPSFKWGPATPWPPPKGLPVFSDD